MGRHSSVHHRHRYRPRHRPAPGDAHTPLGRPPGLPVILVAIAAVLIATNPAAYAAGRRSQAEANTRLERNVASLEADLEGVRAAQAGMRQANEVTLTQVRRDMCAVAGRGAARDTVVRDVGGRYGCTVTVPVAGPTRPPSLVGGAGAGGTTQPAGRQAAGPGAGGSPARQPEPELIAPQQHAPQPATPAAPPPAPEPAPAPATPETTAPSHSGLLCLPLLGCVL
ncbi:hypothetical protein [Rhizomonospora bruguierae]|uniref:hypothetical protein n=1 Tax=Rhizomonospora bruguierae TaxID=1581705 RepID=UPI001BCBE95E|nr:hypothetical protein [Micromonospora sp. NBRC 107566]